MPLADWLAGELQRHFQNSAFRGSIYAGYEQPKSREADLVNRAFSQAGERLRPDPER